MRARSNCVVLIICIVTLLTKSAYLRSGILESEFLKTMDMSINILVGLTALVVAATLLIERKPDTK